MREKGESRKSIFIGQWIYTPTTSHGARLIKNSGTSGITRFFPNFYLFLYFLFHQAIHHGKYIFTLYTIDLIIYLKKCIHINILFIIVYYRTCRENRQAQRQKKNNPHQEWTRFGTGKTYSPPYLNDKENIPKHFFFFIRIWQRTILWLWKVSR
jgi:hypothetical protein